MRPSRTASNISSAGRPGVAGMLSTPHSAATSARSAALAGSRWPGSSVAMPPASRPPMALGWPVSENGPAPGLPICPVARCRWISAAFFAVPLLDWFRPMVYSDRAAGARANQRAAWTISAAGTPQIAAAASGVYARMRSCSAPKPSVWPSIWARSTSASATITCSMAWKSATSVPGRMGRCRSAAAAVSVRRGSATMMRMCGRAARAASRRRNSTGWAYATLAPVMNTVSACSRSS